MNIWHDIDASRIRPDRFIVCIEISKGSKKISVLDIEGADGAQEVIRQAIDSYSSIF